MAAALLLAGCVGGEDQARQPSGADGGTSVGGSSGGQGTTSAPPQESPTASPPATPSRPADRPDPRWRFFSADRTRHASPWFPGRHRVMIGYGCTPAPYYSPDPRCDGQGFHHGIDVALPCGTPLLSGVRARVVVPAPGTVGPAYGDRPLLLRTVVDGEPTDVLVAHARRVLTRPGEQVQPGDRVATAGASGAPDGCHLHLEVRSAGGDVTSARDPAPVLQLRRPG